MVEISKSFSQILMSSVDAFSYTVNSCSSQYNEYESHRSLSFLCCF